MWLCHGNFGGRPAGRPRDRRRRVGQSEGWTFARVCAGERCGRVLSAQRTQRAALGRPACREWGGGGIGVGAARRGVAEADCPHSVAIGREDEARLLQTSRDVGHSVAGAGRSMRLAVSSSTHCARWAAIGCARDM